MNNENKLTPKYRFPEFKNDGSWNEKTVIDTADKTIRWSFTGGPFGSNLKSSDYTSKGIRIIQLQNIGDGVFNDNYKIYTSIDKADELLSSNIYSGDIILSKMGDPVGRACIMPGKNERYLMASDGIRLAVNEKEFSKYFIFSHINSDLTRNKIESKSTGSTRKRIGLDVLKEIPLLIPKTLLEQQKIAVCLSSLDDVIAAHEEKLTALEEHKKGLLQNLFPQEGETKPKYRFPEFENDGDWVDDCMGNYIDLFSGIPIKSENITDDKNGTPILRGINITEGFVRHSNDIDKYYLESIESIKKYLTKLNDIVIGMDGSKVGKNVAQITRRDENSILIQRVACIRNKNNSDNKYLYQQFISNRFIKYVDNVNTSSGIPHISAQQIKDFRIMIPPVLAEQQKIASVLSSVDELIVAQREKIEVLKEHKKGLMQGLFPKLEA